MPCLIAPFFIYNFWHFGPLSIIFDHTYSYNLAVVASWSQRGSSAPGAESLPWQPPSDVLGRSVTAAWNRCMRTQGVVHPTPIMGTLVQDTCREWLPEAATQVQDEGDLRYYASGLFPYEVARRAEEEEYLRGGRRPGCPLGCRCSGRVRGLVRPGWCHQREGRQFWSFLISPWWLQRERARERGVRFCRCTPVRASARKQWSLFSHRIMRSPCFTSLKKKTWTEPKRVSKHQHFFSFDLFWLYATLNDWRPHVSACTGFLKLCLHVSLHHRVS